MKFSRYRQCCRKSRAISYAFASALTIASSGALFASVASAAPTVTYTFDGGSYFAGQLTPLNNAAPDLDPANTGFRANFGDSAAGGTFELYTAFAANTSGLTLYEPTSMAALSISTSVPVTSVSLNWAANATAATGAVVLTDANGDSMVFTDTSGATLGAEGSLTYTSATPFAGFALQAYGTAPAAGSSPDLIGLQPLYDPNSPTSIDVDNLVFTLAVPEPSTWALMGLGAVSIATVILRRRQCTA